MNKGKKYNKNLPRKMYLYFLTYDDQQSPPSFSKFARQIGLSLEELISFRKKKIFDKAYLECSEIRRDYLIDRALTKRFDPSFVKYLLESEDAPSCDDSELLIRLEVTE